MRLSALVLAVFLAAPAGQAATREAHIAVGATVLASTTLVAEQRADFLELGAADLARGYIELPRALELLVTNTSPAGFALDVWPASPLFAALQIEGAGAQVVLPAEGGAITLRGAHRGAERLALGVRLLLKPGLEPGRYPWPLKLTARPL